MVLSGCDFEREHDSEWSGDAVPVARESDDDAMLELSAGARRDLFHALASERKIMQGEWLDLVEGTGLDLLEICAPWDSPLVQAVREAGGRAYAIGPHNGYDLSTRQGFLRAAALIRETRPKYVHVSPPCFPWTVLQMGSQRTPQQVQELQAKRRVSRKLLRNCCKLVEIQRQENSRHAGMCQGDAFERYAGGEQPLSATSWELPEFKRVVQMCGGSRFVVFGCMHGLRDRETGRPHKKSWGWVSSKPSVQQALEIPCCHPSTNHEPVQGGRKAARSAIYPPILCKRFAKALLRSMYQGDYTKECGRTPSKSSYIFAGDSEAVAEDVDNEAEADREEGRPEQERRGEPEFVWDPEIKRKLILAHRNLGHPNNEAFLKLLRSAGARPEVLRQAEHFECAECRQRGRRANLRPATLPHYTQKWQCLSIDTFWWHTPREALQGDQRPEHLLCLSMLDEASDFHAVHVVRASKEGPQRNMSGPEFRQSFSQGWLKQFPAPQVLRYDEEGFLKRLDVVEWLEALSIRLEPVAGESPWQVGKHSKHIQTLKESMNLLAMEFQNSLHHDELLGLSVSAKNNMHNVRGYSPNQWAFGQNSHRISSFLSSEEHTPTESAREYETFEEALKRETAARKYFLEIDARRRVQRALRAQGRPLREFGTGTLVYYYRRGRKEGSRYGGHWYGPARVLCHEKTGGPEFDGRPGSIVWISHAGRLLRCSPEQIREVTGDLKRLDQDLEGPRTFHDMLQHVVNQQRYLDITLEQDLRDEEAEQLEEVVPKHRLRGKQADPNQPAVPAQDSNELPRHPERPSHGHSRPPSPVPRDLPDGPGPHRSTDRDRARPYPEPERHRGEQVQDQSRKVQREDVRDLVQRPGLPEVADRAQRRRQEDHIPGNEADPGPAGAPSSTASTRAGNQPDSNVHGAGSSSHRGTGERKRRISFKGDQGGQRGPIPRRDERVGRGDGPMESSGSSGDRPGRDSREPERHGRPHEQDGAHDGSDSGRAAATAPDERRDTPVRSRSRSPRPSPDDVLYNEHNESPQDSFVGYVGKLHVIEMAFNITPRDVHKSRGVWTVNQKAKKNVEVQLRKLNESERAEFQKAMQTETDSFMSTEAVKICERAGIPADRIMRMRFVFTWKPVSNAEGVVTGHKPKARLIVRGFEDPELLQVPRESPTLSHLGRNLLLTQCAHRGFKVSVGDIRTAFLRGEDTEWCRQVYADPPSEVKQHIGMTDTQVFRIVKAIYGLLHAPKMWHESLSKFLLEQGWTRHATDQCLYKLVDPRTKEVIAYLGVHVDDIITGGEGSLYKTKIAELRQRYPFGSWQCAQDEVVMYCGCELSQNASFRLTLRQERFAASVDEINLTRDRQKQTKDPVTKSEKGELRRVLGALNWRATQSAPWLLATVSHLQGCVEQACVEDLLSANKLVRLQRRYADRGISFESALRDPVLVTYTDASWATRRDLSSQGGQLTVLMESKVLKGQRGKFSVICWSSKRLRRVARSSTSAEVQMCGNAVDTHEFSKLSYIDMLSSRILNLRQADQYLQEFPSVLVCDSRNVYDGLAKVETSGLHMEEKRAAIELLGIKERFEQANVCVRWVDSDQELADSLTKPWVYEQLIRALDLGCWTIVFDAEMMSAKKKRQLRRNGDHAQNHSVIGKKKIGSSENLQPIVNDSQISE